MKSVSNELEISIKKVDNDDYKIFYKGILLDELAVIPLNDFHFNIKLNNSELALVAREASHNFRFITGSRRFYAYLQQLFKSN